MTLCVYVCECVTETKRPSDGFIRGSWSGGKSQFQLVIGSVTSATPSPPCPSVGPLACHIFLKGREVTPPCSYRRTFSTSTLPLLLTGNHLSYLLLHLVFLVPFPGLFKNQIVIFCPISQFSGVLVTLY